MHTGEKTSEREKIKLHFSENSAILTYYVKYCLLSVFVYLKIYIYIYIPKNVVLTAHCSLIDKTELRKKNKIK